jgi:hypothetical protein
MRKVERRRSCGNRSPRKVARYVRVGRTTVEVQILGQEWGNSPLSSRHFPFSVGHMWGTGFGVGAEQRKTRPWGARKSFDFRKLDGAGPGARTRDLHLGKDLFEFLKFLWKSHIA